MFRVLTVATGSVQFDLEAMGENGEFSDMVMDLENASFTQKAGATLLLVGELTSDLGFPGDGDGETVQSACSVSADFFVDGIPAAGTFARDTLGVNGAGLSDPRNVLGIAPSGTDRPGTLMAVARASCMNEGFPVPEEPVTVELQVAVLSFG